MSDAKDKKNPPAKGSGDNVVHLSRCPVCGSKPEKAGFCGEHFAWFKFGLVNKKGEKPIDFDKKFMAFQKRFKKVA